ncbi:MAG: hypothetical protein GY869_29415, partial [Planctomycetes bacterium]|nr:hypothetical protein [Planctomycetota bacterium]
DQLQVGGYDVTYITTFPPALQGFEAVFLSFGNSGDDYARFTGGRAIIVLEYLQNEGRVYLEGGDAMNNQINNQPLLRLFGIVAVAPGDTQSVFDLTGQAGTVGDGMLFTASNQPDVASIDTYSLFDMDNMSQAVFIQNGDKIAVQNAVVGEQRTFCFSYALAHLQDAAPPSTRANLLMKIVDFFTMPDSTLAIEGPDVSSPISLQLYQNYPNPFNPSTIIQ